MASPPLGQVVPHLRKHTAAWVAALMLGLPAATAAAQDSASGTDSASPGTSAPTAADTAPSPDSARRAAGDTLAPAPRDTTAPRDSAAAPPPPARPPAPVDSALGAACKDAKGISPDLLLVSFRPTATKQERDAVAREVGGRVVGASTVGPPASYYLSIPGGGSDRAVADRLILLAPVLQVGTTRCPP